MAATAAGQRLTEAHRLAQARLGASTIQAMRAVWPLLDPLALDASFQRWLTAALPIINGQRSQSARLAASYLSAYKKLELGPDAVVNAVLAEMIPAEQVATALRVSGPVSIKRAAMRGELLTKAVNVAESNTARSGLRLALGGGRDTITATTRADRQAQGWARATSGRPCAFCAMLASRGPMYDAESVHFHAHDGCHCTAEPVYRSDSALPAGSQQWADLWTEATRAPGDTETVFRQLVAST